MATAIAVNMIEIATEVAQHLAERWRVIEGVSDPQGIVILECEDGTKMVFWADFEPRKTGPSVEVAATRLTVFGDPELQEGTGEKSKNVRITVALDRGPEAIAREIERRFLQRYRAAKEQAAERERQQVALEQQIAEIWGLEQGQHWMPLDVPGVTGGVVVHPGGATLWEIKADSADLGLALAQLVVSVPKDTTIQGEST